MRLFIKLAQNADDGSIDALLGDIQQAEPDGQMPAPADPSSAMPELAIPAQPAPAADIHLQIRENLLRAIGDE